MRITFLGTNGWFATEKGNTICTLIETAGRYIVLDAGDGIRRLMESAPDQTKPLDIFISHFHLDHIIGLHQLNRFHYRRIRIFVQPEGKRIVDFIVNKPFTDALESLPNVEVKELAIGRNKVSDGLGSYSVDVAWLSHADPCIGFRFELLDKGRKKVVAHCLDSGPCDAIKGLSAGADLMIAECGNLPGEGEDPAWPHMSPEIAAGLALEAKAKTLVLTHFAAHKYPAPKDRKAACKAAKEVFARTTCASDGLTIEI
ncbi:MAG: MBL fold metallo-hydrolase [Candidatus Micrarchaeia archaeon]|jgi:ribonuclease BN (tRNA processing enzyme)